ncbi:hypothetical protein RGV33_18425 [Pseudomonas sp. Bout1]|uniref:hypothetical protein n=1 Tax=Pseudomonas sp. Bout1 TaxID=3048600 RepID=UPI002AB4F91B|nr:hypothetical protein [Pseudomonas sp. Bout1]MDY7533637.1 hypothetical protein [Pseudomonas sp. Bout1]MEB0187464.1 hypothetical protein [Pseudomonas sp. Bout1]
MVKKTLSELTVAIPEAASPELPYVQIQHAINNSLLYPLDAKDGTLAMITVENMQAAPVTLYWAIKDQAEPVFEPIEVPGRTDGNVEIPIPWQRISTCIGHTVLIWYTATVAGRPQESLVLELEIQDVREADLRVSLPVFLHSRLEWSTWWLNMYEFQGDETIQIKAWPMIQADQRLFVTVAGDQHIVPYQFIWVAYDHVVTAAEAHADHLFEFRLARGWMSLREDYSALTTHMGVIWDGTAPILPAPDDPVHENPLPINAQDFHLRTTTLLRVDPALGLPPPHLKESTEFNGSWVVNPTNTLNGAHLLITYEGIHAGDRVCPTFSGTPGLGSPAIGCRTVQAGETSLEFWVPPSAISANFAQNITLTYTVSHSGTGPWLSPPRVVNILDVAGLPTPQVEQATGNTLDLNTLSGDADCTVITWPYIELGQVCWLNVISSTYSFQVLEGEPVTEQWLGSGVNTPLPRSELKKLADCSEFEVHFAVNFNGLADKASAKKFPVLTLGIVQEDLVLDAPTVREAVGSQLTVYNGRDGVTVRVAYEGINPRQTISVCWKQPDGSCLPLASKPGTSNPKYVDFQIPREAVIEGSGKTITINYTVISACKHATSEDLNLQISVPVRLPTPVVPEATPPATQGGILDLRTFNGDAHITLEKWWFILEGQVGYMDCIGTKDDDSAYTIRVMIGEPITDIDVENGLSRVLKREELEKLRNETSLLVVFQATTQIGGTLSNSIEFPTLQLEFGKRFRDETDFDPDYKGWNNWQKGAGATDPRDLELKYGAGPQSTPMYYLFDWGYTNTRNPVTQREKLYKVYTELESGRSYRFSAWVHDNSGVNNKPRMVLVAQGVEVTPVTEPGTAWQLLQGVFVATSHTMRLSVDNLQMGIAPGNDFEVTLLIVEEV